ncbi:ChaN family lipoprotein [uncultured Cohaesibacter sp.]|uniref:ChaN family lipoprotein n=1 Tax=uncultured Cohaesibacter sp. TaxID=1002546 RepID=UPI0029C8232D|nr:ChaN family lipoprotein [uncultured Cohaesibacter sp.]
MLLDDHSLAGRLYHVDAGAPVDIEALTRELQSATHVLIGEKHDNPVHHEKQAELVRLIGKAGRTGQITFEMIEQRYAGDLKPEGELDLTSLGEALEWEARGWPSWSQYAPIFEAALAADMRLKAGNPDRDEMMLVGRGNPVRGEAAA